VPVRSSKAFEDTSNLDMGMGPIGSELGGHIIVVEVAHNEKFDIFKIFCYNIYVS
jgi:hypothetical protein